MGYTRDESMSERLDRNWAELLQELRVTQMGIQILTAFLLTIAFQERFTELDGYQVALYITLVAVAACTTILGLAPVMLHRRLFRQGEKDRVVDVANVFLRLTIAGVSIVLVGTLSLIVDFVLGRGPGIVAAVICALALIALWLALPSGSREAGDEEEE
jgi:hypothetical protein